MLSTRVAVCGLGRLGACIAAVFSDAGFKVVGIETDKEKIEKINKGLPPVQEPGLATPYFRKIELGGYDYAVEHSDVCFFALPTPSSFNGTFDNSYLIDAMTEVAKAVGRHQRMGFIFVINSTVTPKSCDNVFIPLLENIIPRNTFRWGLCYKPEFIALGTVMSDLRNPDVLLVGESESWVGRYIEQLYCKNITTQAYVKRMSLLDSELAKISLNCFVTMKISFANQVGMIANELGADANEILGMVGADSRVGPKCLKPGLPYGGPCFPRDNKMFRSIAQSAPLATASDTINNQIKEDILLAVLNHHKIGTHVGILGMAYKPGVHVTDESLGCWLEDQLVRKGVTVKTYDSLALCRNTLDEVTSCDIVVVACASSEFSSLSLLENVVLIDPSATVKTHTVKESHATA